MAARDGVTGVVTGERSAGAVAAGRCTTGGGNTLAGSGGGTTFGAAACALGSGGAGAAGTIVDGRDGSLGAEGCEGAFESCSGVTGGPGVTGGLTGGVAIRCATVRSGTTAPGFGGAAGASRKMTSERPTNPSATAAIPYRTSVFKEPRALSGEREYPSEANSESARFGRTACSVPSG